MNGLTWRKNNFTLEMTIGQFQVTKSLETKTSTYTEIGPVVHDEKVSIKFCLVLRPLIKLSLLHKKS